MAPPRYIPLSDKQVPTAELLPQAQANLHPLTATICPIDIRPLVAEIERHGASLWTETGQQDNLRFHRAFHDKLGVDQAVFTFCDDLLERVYRLPWWRKWQAALAPIFAEMDLDPSQVIRCLLARLPPGVEIPVHHDTGLWSMRSHRVHVPLETSAQNGDESRQVVFSCGATEDQMVRVKFEAGIAVELNNRAKHAVKNNWTKHRVHLILDYVERSMPLEVVDLTVHDFVEQTRRAIIVHPAGRPPALKYPSSGEVNGLPLDSPERVERTTSLMALVDKCGGPSKLDFLKKCKRFATGECSAREYATYLIHSLGPSDSAKALQVLLPLITDVERKDALETIFEDRHNKVARAPRSPRYVIIGAMKCGTTSLYAYLNQHPEVCPANGKEPHYFDWKWDKVCKINVTDEMRASGKKLIRWTDNPTDEQVKYLLPFRTEDLVCHPEWVSGEATPSYLLGGVKVARRMLEATSPSLRILVALRDPTLRAFSHYQMTADRTGTPEQLKRRGSVQGKTFEEIVNADLAELKSLRVKPHMDAQLFEDEYLATRPQTHGSHSYVGRGLYALQLRQWFKVFPRECFHFVLLESLTSHDQAHGELEKVFEFIGVEPSYRVPDLSKRNARTYKQIPEDTERVLREYYRPFVEDLEELLDMDLSAWKR